jgi:hypothetical protein
VSNLRVTKSALRSWSLVAVWGSSKRPAILRETSGPQRKGVELDGLMVYSPGQSKKKKPRDIMSAKAWLPMELVAKAMASAWVMTTETGRGLTRFGRGCVLSTTGVDLGAGSQSVDKFTLSYLLQSVVSTK